MSQWWLVVPVVVIATLYVARSLLPRGRRRAPGSGSGCHDCAASGHGAGNAAGGSVKR